MKARKADADLLMGGGEAATNASVLRWAFLVNASNKLVPVLRLKRVDPVFLAPATSNLRVNHQGNRGCLH